MEHNIHDDQPVISKLDLLWYCVTGPTSASIGIFTFYVDLFTALTGLQSDYIQTLLASGQSV